jgi:hypothetical protein
VRRSIVLVVKIRAFFVWVHHTYFNHDKSLALSNPE